MNKIHRLITDRWSPVAFDDRAVELERIHLLFEAAKWAPSSVNSQPWRFIYATKEMPEYPIFLELYRENTSKRSRLYPGVREGLDYLKSAGYRLTRFPTAISAGKP